MANSHDFRFYHFLKFMAIVNIILSAAAVGCFTMLIIFIATPLVVPVVVVSILHFYFLTVPLHKNFSNCQGFFSFLYHVLVVIGCIFLLQNLWAKNSTYVLILLASMVASNGIVLLGMAVVHKGRMAAADGAARAVVASGDVDVALVEIASNV